MKLTKTNRLTGTFSVPGDKSISHRGVLFGAISEGVTTIEGFLMGDDCMSTIRCFEQLGVKTERDGTTVTVHGRGLYGLQKPADVLYTGNSGTTTRLLLGLLAGQSFSSVLDGDATIRKRPMKRVADPLAAMGAVITCTNGSYCPLAVTGSPLSGITYSLPVASAQLKSALLLAGLYAQGETCVIEPQPSRDHTERMLPVFGGQIQRQGLSIRVTRPEKLTGARLKVPGDFSSAAFFLVAGLLVPHSELLIQNVGVNPTRTGLLSVLLQMGADITQVNQRIWGGEPVADLLVRTSRLKAVDVGGTIIPTLIDEIPILAVAAAFAQGTTVIHDAAELKVKESNRIDTVTAMLRSAGLDARPTEDGMAITGGPAPQAAVFETHGDHRIAMSAAVLSLLCEGTSTIEDAECASVSYPSFYSTLEELKRN